LSEDDVPDGVHIALRCIDNPRLLDAVIDHEGERAAAGGGIYAPFLDGGAVLRVKGLVVASPACCVGLSDGIQDWVRLAMTPHPDWTMVWTGHPWVLARVVDDDVEVSEQAEAPSPRAVARCSVADLQGAVDQALADRESFAHRLESRLRQTGSDEPVKIARTIAGLTPDE